MEYASAEDDPVQEKSKEPIPQDEHELEQVGQDNQAEQQQQQPSLEEDEAEVEEQQAPQEGEQEGGHLLSTMFCEGEHMELKSADQGYEGSWYLVKVTAVSGINESARKLQRTQTKCKRKKDLLVVPYESESKKRAKVRGPSQFAFVWKAGWSN